MNISRFTFNMFGVNTYILWDDISKEAAIIDPGMINDVEKKEIDEFIKINKLRLKYLINTHMHIDHSFGVAHIRDKYGLALMANTDDQFLAERLNQQAKMFCLSIPVADLAIETVLKDGDKLKIGDEDIIIMQVPGHSPGSIVIYAIDSNFIISGDVLFQHSIGRTDLPGGNYQQLINTINNKLMTLPDDTIVYPGHGFETTIIEEKKHNPYI
ncbi:MAG: MBL fold metallo-hydrolase [Muribaculaceae bacterium]|nr:MBL fold metallo-hydrolase [Muribaculaceae bacterium]